MKILFFLLVSPIFFSCKKSNNSADTRLLRTESTDYNGNVLYTEYGYDDQGRIITITTHENSEQPVVAVTISYNAGEAVLLSHPDADPAYNRTTEVHLTLDANGRMMKRMEYTLDVAKTFVDEPTQKFRYDTLLCEYDAAGLLKSTARGRYDSTWVDPTFYSVTRLADTTSYINDAGNLINSHEYAVYPVTTSQGGVITVSGGSSEYHNAFSYTKSFPNKTDFKNVAVLNEYALYYEPLLNTGYKNLTDQVIRNSVDRDRNGAVIFTGSTTIAIGRGYNTEGLLYSVSVLSQNTEYTMINYFYGQ